MQVLKDHTDEVWHVAFSPDGQCLATASQDGYVLVYQVVDRKKFEVKYRLKMEVSDGWPSR